jgi:uncharacterized membrane protein YfcA
MVILGYVFFIVIGILLGLIGGGGSVLSIPVLVYLFKLSPLTATSYSLVIIGVASAVGVFSKLKEGLFNLKSAILFAVPSAISVIIARRIILPFIPEIVFQIGHHSFTKGSVLLIFFSVLMIYSSIQMIKPVSLSHKFVHRKEMSMYLKYILMGSFTGLLTGLVGAGGGFIIIPTLVLIGGLQMKNAISTSLIIITLNSLIGFWGDVWSGQVQMNWEFLMIIISLSISGVLFGNKLSKGIDQSRLKKWFGIFVLVLGSGILLKEISMFFM